MVEKVDGTPAPQKMTEHSSPAVVCGDGSTDTDSHSKEEVFYPQPVSRDSAQPGTPSSQEPSQRDHQNAAQPLSSGPTDGSRSSCRASVYPSNHDRMLTAQKQQPVTPLDGKGASSWTLARLCELDSLDLQPPSTLAPGKSELTEATSGLPDVPGEGQHLLLSNGHLPQAHDPSPECPPLTGQLPGTQSARLLFAPQS